MIEWLARLSRRPSAYIAATVLVALVVVVPYAVGRSKTSTSDTTVAPTTVEPSTTVEPTTTIDPATPETDRSGDPANPGAVYPDRPDTLDNDHERLVGLDQEPARLSGYSAWVASVTAEATGPDGAAGPFLKITIRVVNRDEAKQSLVQTQWTMRRPDGIVVKTSYATPTIVAPLEIEANSEAFAEIWFATSGTGRYWLRFRPDQGSARGIWAIEAT